jgi:hypothetical protein
MKHISRPHKLLNENPCCKRREQTEGVLAVLRRLFGSIKEITGGRGREGWEKHAADIGEIRNAHKIVHEKPRVNRPLERPTHRCEDVEWIHLTHKKFQLSAAMKTVLHL